MSSLRLTSDTDNEDCLYIFLRDFEIGLHVGIYDFEQKKPQPVVINIECKSSLHVHYNDTKEKNMDRVIDYSRLCHFIKNDIPKMGHIYLLESLADAIISYCFTDSRVEKVLVRIDKTGAFSEATSAGIQIIRTRKRLKP